MTFVAPYFKITSFYIIGNGFDLHHEIQSSYRCYEKWLESNSPEIYNAIIEIYDCDKEWWSDFEKNIGSLNIVDYTYKVAFANQPDLCSEHCDAMHGDAQVAVNIELSNLFSSIKDSFHDWISRLNKPITTKRIRLNTENSLFLSFNYTKTLEELYGIDASRVLHIHGCVDDDENFIIGHGSSLEDLRNTILHGGSKCQCDINSEEDREWQDDITHSLFYQLAEKTTLDIVSSQRKPVDKLMIQYSDFFSALSNIPEIYVYGLSLSPIDLPYLEKIAGCNPYAVWEFSDFKGENLRAIKEFTSKNSIRKYQIVEL